jgi:MFS family permease
VGCSNAGWSAVSSAGPMSALAGVLAGFMLNGIVVLLSRTMTDIGKVRALGLLLAAFVALGLDSYLFALVTGDSSCHRAWTEAMLAAALLGIGAVAIIAGFGLLVAEYVEKKDSESITMLTTLFNVLRVGVALVVLGLLFMTSWNYLYAVLGSHVPGYATDLLWIYFAIGVLGLIVLVVMAIVSAIVKRRKERLAKQPALEKHKIAAPAPEEQPQKPRKLASAAKSISNRLGGSLEFKQKVKRAIYWSFGYAIVSVLGAAVFARTSPRHWDQPDTLVTAAFIATVAWVLVVALVPLFYLLVRCSPPFGDGGAGQGQQPEIPRYPRRRPETTRSPARKPRSRQQPRGGRVPDHRRRSELHFD